MVKKKKTTEEMIEDLATMMQREFLETRKDIKEVKEHVDQVEFRLTGWTQRIEILEDKVRMLGVKVGLK